MYLIKSYCVLTYVTGTLLCSLIQGGYITDKVVVRRLLKPVINYCEHGGIVNNNNTTSSPAEEVRNVLTIQAPHSTVISEEQSVLLHYTYIAILAEVYTLVNTTNIQQVKYIFPAVKTTIASMLAEHKEVLVSIWWAMMVDTARIVWYNHSTAAVAATIQAKAHSGAHDLDALFGRPASAVSTEPSTPSSTGDTTTATTTMHPLRGGLTYTSTAAITNTSSTTSNSSIINPAIAQYLAATLSTVTDAHMLSTRTIQKQKQSTGQLSIPSEHVLPLYSVLFNSFTSYFHENKRNTTSTTSNTTTSTSTKQTLEHFLNSFLLLAQYDAYLYDTSTNNAIYLIPVTEWIELVSLLLAHSEGIMQYTTTIHILIELLTVLADRIPTATASSTSTNTGSTTTDALWGRVWQWTVLLLQQQQPSLFPGLSTAAWCTQTSIVVPPMCTSIDALHSTSSSTGSSSSPESLIPLVNILCKLANTKIAVSAVISQILSLLLLSTTIFMKQTDSSSSGSSIVSAVIHSLCNIQNSEILPNICLQLQQYIHDYTLYTTTSTTTSSIDYNDNNISTIVDILFQAWRAVALKIHTQVILSFSFYIFLFLCLSYLL